MLAEGWSISDVARYFNTSPSTVHYWKSKKTSETADARYKLDWMAFQTSWVLHPEMSLADLAELHGVTYQTARYAANALGLKR